MQATPQGQMVPASSAISDILNELNLIAPAQFRDDDFHLQQVCHEPSNGWSGLTQAASQLHQGQRIVLKFQGQHGPLLGALDARGLGYDCIRVDKNMSSIAIWNL
jgi:hypothetical protein